MGFFAYMWIGLLILFLMVEGSTVALVSLWFAVGSLAAIVAALLGASLVVQVGIFLAVSGVLLALLRPFLRKYVAPSIQKTNVDSLIGKCCPVTDAICNLESRGQVKIGGMVWSARSESGADIPEGTVVKVRRIEGVKLIVSPVPVPETV